MHGRPEATEDSEDGWVQYAQTATLGVVVFLVMLAFGKYYLKVDRQCMRDSQV